MPGAGPAFANVVITPIFVINMFDLPRRNALQHSFRAVGGAVAGGRLRQVEVRTVAQFSFFDNDS